MCRTLRLPAFVAGAIALFAIAPARVEQAQPGPVDRILSFFESTDTGTATLVRLVVDDPWQREPRVGRPGLRPVRVHVQGRRRDLNKARLVLSLTSRETGQAVWSTTVSGPSSVQLDLAKTGFAFPWGAYDLKAVLRDDAAAELYSTSALVTVLPGDAHRVEVLNNLVSELAAAKKRGMLAAQEIPFMNPRDGWCWFQLAGEAQATLDRAEQPLLAARAGQRAAEAMRRLPAGKHVLRVEGTPEDVVVRAVPVLFYNVYQTGTQIGPFGIQTWDVLERDYFAACNTIEGARAFDDETARWRAEGKEWVLPVGVPERGGRPLAPEEMVRQWQQNPGYSHPLLNGMQVDEFTGRYSDGDYLAFADAVARLAADGRFRGRQFIPFVTIDPDQPGKRRFIEALLAAGWPFAIEIYIPEKPGAQADQAEIERRLAARAARWEALVPGSFRRAIVAPMFSSLPYCMTNTLATADFKVHLEMQMQVLANHPALFGVYGVEPYRSNYADPETLRWMGRLMRHYGVEGRRERVSSDPYDLRHVENPDFDEGLKGWEVRAAELGSVRAGSHRGYGALQGRWPPSEPCGANFVILRRSAKTPNAVSQPIRGLQAGRLYCLKVITADYQDLLAGRTNKAKSAVSIRLEGVEVLPGDENAFQWPIQSYEPVGAFTAQRPFWMNYHWRVFRAKGTSGKLTITDWQDDTLPGGPAGQETMVNFVELQPYFGRDEH